MCDVIFAVLECCNHLGNLIFQLCHAVMGIDPRIKSARLVGAVSFPQIAELHRHLEIVYAS